MKSGECPYVSLLEIKHIKMKKDFLIGVVGPCASGKSTLINHLEEQGYQARHIAQEHSFVQDMWQRVTDPDVLIYLDISYEESIHRRPQNYNEKDHQVQLDRLRHARTHADLYIHTDNQSIGEIENQVLAFLAKFS